MPRLPKIAIERLKATPHIYGAPVRPTASAAIEHPDANLLSAFAERSLTERERTEVLNHLAGCAECREITTLAVASEPDVIEPAPAVIGRSGRAWGPVRWAAFAVALGAAAMVVILRPATDRRPGAISNDFRSTMVADANQPAPPPEVEAPAPERSPRAAVANSGARSRVASGGKLRAQTGPHEIVVGAAGLYSHGERGRSQQTAVGSVLPPKDSAKRVPAAGGQEKTAKDASGLAGNRMPTAPPPPDMLSQMAASSDEKAKLQLSPAAPPERAAGTTERNAPAAASTNVVAGPAKESTASGAAGASFPMAPRRGGRPMMALGGMSSGQELAKKQGPGSMRWSVSGSGKVQRSEDGRKTWEDVKVADGVTFRVIAAAGSDVWAGGSGEALFHSIDAGATWKRVDVISPGSFSKEAIVGIQERSPLQVVITLESGQQWMTENGGQTWRTQP